MSIDVTDGFIEIEDFLQDANEFLTKLQLADPNLKLAPVLESLFHFQSTFIDFLESSTICAQETCACATEKNEEDFAEAMYEAVNDALLEVLGYVPDYSLSVFMKPETVH